MQVYAELLHFLKENSEGDRKFASKVVKAQTTFPVCKTAGEKND